MRTNGEGGTRQWMGAKINAFSTFKQTLRKRWNKDRMPEFGGMKDGGRVSIYFAEASLFFTKETSAIR